MARDHAEFRDRIDRIGAAEWHALGADHHPFTRHEFLAALEHSGSVGKGSGWEARYLTLRDARGLAARIYLRFGFRSPPYRQLA